MARKIDSKKNRLGFLSQARSLNTVLAFTLILGLLPLGALTLAFGEEDAPLRDAAIGEEPLVLDEPISDEPMKAEIALGSEEEHLEAHEEADELGADLQDMESAVFSAEVPEEEISPRSENILTIDSTTYALTKTNLKTVLTAGSGYSDAQISAADTLKIIGNNKGTALALGGWYSGESESIPYLNTKANIKTIDFSEFTGTLADYTLSEATAIQRVILGESIKGLPSAAFYGCSSLVTVRGPGGVEGIVDLSSTQVTELGKASDTSRTSGVFSGCPSIKKAVIGGKITRTQNHLFSGNSALETVIIEGAITTLSGASFQNCTSLKTLSFSRQGAIDNEGIVDLTSVRSAGGNLFSGCENITKVVLGGVTFVSQQMFAGCKKLSTIAKTLEAVNDPSNQGILDLEQVTGFGTSTFNTTFNSGDAWENHFSKVALGTKISTIPYMAFAGCKNISTVWDTVENVKKPENEGVINLAVTGVTSLDPASEIGQQFINFQNPNMKTIIIGDKITEEIPKQAFHYVSQSNYATAHLGSGGSLALGLQTFSNMDVFVPGGREKVVLKGNIFSSNTTSPSLLLRGFADGSSGSPTELEGASHIASSGTVMYYYKITATKTGEGSVTALKETDTRYSPFIISSMETIERDEGALGQNENYIKGGLQAKYTLTPAEGYEVASVTVNEVPFNNFSAAGGTITLPAVTADTNLEVVFAPAKTYTVTYDFNDDNKTEDKVFDGLDLGDATPTVENPSRPGYIFGGWDPTVAATVEGDTTYTAQWTPRTDTPYKIKFFYQFEGSYGRIVAEKGIIGTSGAFVEVSDEDKEPDADGALYVLDLDAPNVFSGYIAGDGTLELKVYFKQQFIVTYAPGAQGAFEKIEHKNLEYGDFTPAAPVAPEGNPGYVFAGWSPTVEEKITGFSSWITYTAQWEKEEYTITYDFNDGVTEAKIFEECTFGEDTPTIDNPARTGYTFAGWEPAVTATVEGNATYTARWTPGTDTPYTIQFFEKENGSYPENPTEELSRVGTTGKTVAVTDADKVRAGYVLDSSAANIFSGVVEADGSLVLKLYFKQDVQVIRKWVEADKGGTLVAITSFEDSFIAEDKDTFSLTAKNNPAPEIPEKYSYVGYLLKTEESPIAEATPIEGDPSFEIEAEKGDHIVYYVYKNSDPVNPVDLKKKPTPITGDSSPLNVVAFLGVLALVLAGFSRRQVRLKALQ